jgi:hypothetical protein
MVPEEADDLFGIDNSGHEHMGFVILAANPYMTRRSRIRNLLYRSHPPRKVCFANVSPGQVRDRQRGTRGAQRRLGNRVHDVGHLFGSISAGTNAWSTGSGFMDESGKGV